VTCDMLAPLRSRRIGPAECRRIYRGAHAQIEQLLDFATPKDPPPDDDDDGGHGDPSGNGGSSH